MPHSRAICARHSHCAALALITLCLASMCAPSAAADKPILPDAVLKHVLLVEPNFHIRLLGNVSDMQNSLKRTFLDAGHRRAAALLQRWMRAAGMTAWIDAIGNVRGRATGAVPHSPAMFVGSHYDSVVDGGMFDGAMGIISGIAAVKALILEAAVASGTITAAALEEAVAKLSTRHDEGHDTTLNVFHLLPPRVAPPLLPRPVEVAGFADEEGVRFQTTFLGSRALAGTLLATGALHGRTDSQGRSLSDALMDVGMEGTEEALAAAAVDPEGIAGYVEVHLEQGPVLEAAGRPLGVVRGIAGQARLVITLEGEQGHAGTVPMRLRHDPLAGAAEIMGNVEKMCKEVATAGPSAGGDDSLVCTVGALFVWPGAVNVIPGKANFTLDVRAQSDPVRIRIMKGVNETTEKICASRGLRCSVDVRHEVAAVPCNPDLVTRLADAVETASAMLLPALGLPEQEEHPRGEPLERKKCAADSKDEDKAPSCSAPPDFQLPTVKTSSGGEVAVLASGAGHDGMAMADIAPVGMLFVRCRGGVSHSPAEWVEEEDVGAGTAALLQFLRGWEAGGAAGARRLR